MFVPARFRFASSRSRAFAFSLHGFLAVLARFRFASSRSRAFALSIHPERKLSVNCHFLSLCLSLHDFMKFQTPDQTQQVWFLYQSALQYVHSYLL